MQGLMQNVPLTLPHLFGRAETLFFDKELVTATATGIERTDYGTWAERTRRLGGVLEDLGVSESGLGSLIRATYHLLGLRTYFTAGEKEVRAWTIHAGDTAPQAAGVIHSDFERGFIKAETVAYNDLVACGSVAVAREKGLYRMEGKEYVVSDGDVLLFKFNV